MPLGYIIAQTKAKCVYYMPESLFILKCVDVGQQNVYSTLTPNLDSLAQLLTIPTPDLFTLGTKVSILLVYTRCHFHRKDLG